jgi:hypothetical protein
VKRLVIRWAVGNREPEALGCLVGDLLYENPIEEEKVRSTCLKESD